MFKTFWKNKLNTFVFSFYHSIMYAVKKKNGLRYIWVAKSANLLNLGNTKSALL